MMKKSSKVNRLLRDSFQTISHDFEIASAQKGAECQDMARKRIRSDLYKFAHQKEPNLKALYMRQTKATDATRLEGMLEQKWFENAANFRIMSKISPKGVDRVNRILDDRGYGK